MIKPRKRSDAAENCRLILQAAKRLFAEKSVQAVSMHQIAQTAGVGQGTLYRCYAHKGELCAAIAEQVAVDTIKQLENYLDTSGGLPATERIGGILQYIIQFIDDKFQLLLPIHTVHDCEDESAYFRSPMYRFVWDKLTAQYAELEPGYVQNAPDTAEQREAWSRASAKAHILLSSLHPAGVVFMREGMGLTKEQIVSRYCELFAR
ncbi:TetR/AcrR family transcriptional regulator [Cohnella sp. 56]|uniref:TetR/AcrR family transcriptional regulator n=1 Tax=Cohnella sp. 56 TaxID=3113722 RepID=UPI0030E76F99